MAKSMPFKLCKRAFLIRMCVRGLQSSIEGDNAVIPAALARKVRYKSLLLLFIFVK